MALGATHAPAKQLKKRRTRTRRFGRRIWSAFWTLEAGISGLVRVPVRWATSVRGRLGVPDKVQSTNGRLENLEYRPRYLVLGPAACTSFPSVSRKSISFFSPLTFIVWLQSHEEPPPLLSVDSSHEGTPEVSCQAPGKFDRRLGNTPNGRVPLVPEGKQV